MISNAPNKPTICHQPFWMAEVNAAAETLVNNNSWGMIMGKPMIAIMAACCCAFAAIAVRKVNTRLRLIPPNKLTNINSPIRITGLPNNNVKIPRLKIFIKSIRMALNNNFDKTNWVGDAIE